MDESIFPAYFGAWLKNRRKALDMTQSELAQHAGCSLPALRKIESGERRPSKQLAGLLAQTLNVPPSDQATFIRVARGELGIERLSTPDRAPNGAIPPVQKTIISSGNLPRMLTPFIGRETELDALGQLLNDPQCRLLTLVGPGGIGKTRLAIYIPADREGKSPAARRYRHEDRDPFFRQGLIERC